MDADKHPAEQRTPLLPAAGEGAPVSVANLGSPHCLFRFLFCLSVNAAGSETCGTAGACSARSAASPKGAERCQSWVRFSRAALISHTGSQLPDSWGGRAPCCTLRRSLSCAHGSGTLDPRSWHPPWPGSLLPEHAAALSVSRAGLPQRQTP